MTRRKLAVSFMIIGVLLIIAAVSLFLYNSWDERRASEAAEKTARILTSMLETRVNNESPPDTPDTQETDYYDYLTSDAQEEAGWLPAIVYDGNRYVGILDIPAMELSLPVMETWSYPKMKASPCRYIGDPRDDDMVVMAHNYSGHFGKIPQLSYGDRIVFTDAKGTEYVYEVAEIETVNSTDIIGMVENEYDFTMFTCTYGGAARVAVRCIRV